ncbi:MAG: tRNA (adenosine(37)-N6)-threonylcarbamoyltransferase complex ATPase subunit type 1 TsaE, partial [Wenzhouxiangella sp.]
MKRAGHHTVATEADMLALGEKLRPLFDNGGVVYLSGDLGVGKTTLVRGLLRAFGFEGRVKSPSFGLIESYSVAGLEIHHLDLYRLSHGEEIHYLGLEDLLGENSLLLVEWAEKGEGWLPAADWTIHITD